MKSVKLLGKLGKDFGRNFELDIDTPAEAIKALSCQIPGFLEYLNTDDKYFRVCTLDSPMGLIETELHNPTLDTIIITEDLVGSSGGGLFKAVLGGVLIGAAFMTGGISILGMSISGTTMGLLGAALILGGISQALSPNPSKDKEKKEKKSKLISNAGEVTSQGNVVPVAYGEVLIESPVIITSGIEDGTSATVIDRPELLYQRVTQAKLPYRASNPENYNYVINPRNFKPYTVDYLTNRDVASGNAIYRPSSNRLAIEVSFSQTPSGLSVAASYPLQRVVIFAGMDYANPPNRFEIYGGSLSTSLFGLAAFPLTLHTYNNIDLTPHHQFRTAFPVYTFIFYNDRDEPTIGVGELELYGSIGLDEPLANIVG